MNKITLLIFLCVFSCGDSKNKTIENKKYFSSFEKAIENSNKSIAKYRDTFGNQFDVYVEVIDTSRIAAFVIVPKDSVWIKEYLVLEK